MSIINNSIIPSLKESCFTKIEHFSLNELTNAIITTSITYNNNQIICGANNQQIKIYKDHEDLPKLLIEKFSYKLGLADCQELKVFLTVFKKKFFSDSDGKYTQSLERFFFHRLRDDHYSNRGILEVLFETGIDPNVQLAIISYEPKSPLIHFFLRHLHSADAIECLLKNGADYSLKDEKGNSSLHQLVLSSDDGIPNHYCSDGAIRILNLLLQHGAKLSEGNPEGKTPLEFAYIQVEYNFFNTPFFLQNLVIYNQLPSTYNSPVLNEIIKNMLTQLNYQKKGNNVRKPDLPLPLQELRLKLEHGTNPSGYIPLPKRIAFEETFIEEGKKSGEVTLFKDTDITIVDDKQQDVLQLNEVTSSEAAACQALFEQIKNGNTCIQWENSDSFGEKVLVCLKKLLTRPSGRALIYSIVQANHPFFVVRKDGSNNGKMTAIGEEFPILIAVDLTKCNTFLSLKDTAAERTFLRLAHEFLHARLETMSRLASQKLLYSSKGSGWDNLNELFVITGVEGESVLCENMLRFEFGEPALKKHGLLIKDDEKSS